MFFYLRLIYRIIIFEEKKMEEGLPKVPKLELAQWKFILSKSPKDSKTITENLIKEISENSKLNIILIYHQTSLFSRHDSILQ